MIRGEDRMRFYLNRLWSSAGRYHRYRRQTESERDHHFCTIDFVQKLDPPIFSSVLHCTKAILSTVHPSGEEDSGEGGRSNPAFFKDVFIGCQEHKVHSTLPRLRDLCGQGLRLGFIVRVRGCALDLTPVKGTPAMGGFWRLRGLSVVRTSTG
jgi:hypothetical protein